MRRIKTEHLLWLKRYAALNGKSPAEEDLREFTHLDYKLGDFLQANSAYAVGHGGGHLSVWERVGVGDFGR